MSGVGIRNSSASELSVKTLCSVPHRPASLLWPLTTWASWWASRWDGDYRKARVYFMSCLPSFPFLSAFKSMQGGIPEMRLLLQTATHKSTAQSGHKNKSDKLYEIPQARKQRSWKSLLQVNTGAICELKVSVWIARVLTSLVPMRI